MQFNTQNVNGVQDNTSPYNILFEEYYKHGDIAITKNMPEAISVPSEVKKASKDHYMVAGICPLPALEKNSAAKPAAKPSAKPIAKLIAAPSQLGAAKPVVKKPFTPKAMLLPRATDTPPRHSAAEP